MENENKSKKILFLYFFIVLIFLVFLAALFITVIKPRPLPSLYAQTTEKAHRGSIISADNFHLALSKKLYKAVVDTRYIDPQKKELFIKLFSIYSGIDQETIRRKIQAKKGNVVLSFNIDEKTSKYLKKLAFELRRYRVFMELKNPVTGLLSIHGLNVLESGETRIYPYGKVLTPIIGYPHKIEKDGYTTVKGVKGLEKKFDAELQARQDALQRGLRDVNGYIILNKQSYTKTAINGLDIKLTIPLSLQIKIENVLDEMKEKLEAKQVMAVVMDMKNGHIITLASSNRFFPKKIKRSDYPFLRSSAIEYSFEPGSVLKPITFSLLLDKKLINPYDLINGHNGHYKIGKKIITDEHRFSWLSAENVIVYSSNVGMAQLAQKLTGYEFHQGLLQFGFSQKAMPDMSDERVGSIPSAGRLENEIYKATCSYGYGIKVNLLQLLRAYTVFNNNGKMITPRLVDSFIDTKTNKIIPTPKYQPIQVIRPETAQRMKKILIKTVQKGTGRRTIIKGLEIGGKTGTAHIVEDREYVDKYNTSFIGFANDHKAKYTIAVVVIKPSTSHYASKTAVPTFKKIVETLIEDGYLHPNIIK